ncbi:MAG TPA: protein kinase, partial [Thermoanaerobaculia bacterium]|nr:protein kinase [Thermoanaerobaculia bacterium]
PAAEAPAATAGPTASPAPRDEPAPVEPASDESAAPQGAVATTPPAEGDGRRFGHYRLLERIAVGGMAEVWKARMSGVEGFQKTVAIKRILPHMNDDSDFVEMFIDEAKLAAQLNHPNITHIYDLGKIGDDYYIAMEYVDGRNLRAILNESRRKALKLPVGFALVVAARLASALDYAHRKRDFDDRDLELVHRDVSPQNVLISTDGDIKLCDFGISKAVAKLNQTETGALKGKLQYMSPEQAWGRTVDARSDLFSLGALTFEMLTGERLFTGDSEISVLEAVRECRVRRPQQVEPTVPPALEAVVLKALEREPADRFDNAGEMLQALEEILYQLRPTPSQSDVAAFLARLEAAPEVRPGALPPTPEAGTGASTTGSAASADPAPGTASASTATGAAATAGEGPQSGSAAFAPPSAASAAPAAVAGPAGEVFSGLDAEARGGTGTGSRSGWASSAPPAAEPEAAADEATGMEATAGAGGGAGKPTDLPGVPVATAGTAAAGASGKRWWRFGSAPATTPPATVPSQPTAGGAREPARTPADADAEQRESTHDRRESTHDRREATHHDEGTAARAARAEGTADDRSAAGPAGARPSAEPVAAGAAAGVTSASESTATAPAPLPAITGRATVDEDDAGRGRWLLVAAILLLAVLSLATWLWLDRPGRSEARDAAPTADERLDGEPATVPAVPPVAEEPASEATAPPVDLEKLVEEELARQEEEVRRQAEENYRETARRIQAEIDALRRRQESPPPPPPADERSTPPPGDSTPPAPDPSPGSAAAGTAAGGGALRVVTPGEAQYPARARGPWIEQPAARSSTERRG